MVRKPASNSPTLEPDETAQLTRWSFAVVLVFSSALIIGAARGDLWLDEIWSLSFARLSHSVADVFVRFRHDNNHPLNTVFLYWVGEHRTLFIYRLLAVLSGIGSVFLVGAIARREWGAPAALCGIALTGTSFPLLLYFSEARGYASAIFFALASYAILRQNQRHFRPERLVLFWITSVFGILSHATFIMATVAYGVGSLAFELQGSGSLRPKALRILAHHAPPLIFFAWWYWFFLRNMEIGGGPLYSKWEVFSQAAALLTGLPETPVFRSAAIVLVLVLMAVGVIRLRRSRDTQWPFFLTMLCLSPAAMLVLTDIRFLYFRYFIICFPFFFLLLAHLVGVGYRTWPGRWRWLPVVAMAMLIAAQSPRVCSLLTAGRGNYSTALARIAERSPQGVVHIGSDHDFRNRLLVDFYNFVLFGGNRLRYVEQPQWHETPPDWLISHSQDLSYQPPKGVYIEGVGSYRLTDEYRFSGVSGWSWFVFRRETPNNGD